MPDGARNPHPTLAGSQEGKVLGITTGFVAPVFGLMHCDTLQVFTKG